MNANQYTPEEPIVSIATALAPSALGIVRVSGKNCINLVSNVFSRPDELKKALGNTLVYGWIKDKEKLIDEVMIGVYRSPKSFTGEDMIEIFCHGGISVVTAIHKLLLRSGFRQALRGEYTFRSFINGKTDLTKAEAVQEIIQSHTDASRTRAANRLSGSLYEEIDSIKKLIVKTLASIEVEIEYPEDEETIADSFDSSDLHLACERLSSLVDSWKAEKLYQDGARLVLCGKTNAGKSSLFNAILKEERAIVSDIEGTTRDYLESWAGIEGIPVRVFDTAGLRKTDDVIEKQGVELSKNLSNDADLILYLVDSEFGLTEEDEKFLLECSKPLILVWNKSDKITKIPEIKNELKQKIPFFEDEVFLSAKTSGNLGELFKKIKKSLTHGIDTERSIAGLGSERQKQSVQQALESVIHALKTKDFALDAVVQDLEDCLDSLGEVTGEITPDDVLGEIFSNFCVGK